MRTDYYAVLGLDSTATAKEIKKAYKRRASQWHPDKWVGKSIEEIEDAEAIFKDIEEAYRVLKDPVNRAHYDKTGESEMPKTGQMAVKKIIELFAKHIKEALQQEMAADEMGGSSFGSFMSSQGPSMDTLLSTVRSELTKEKKQLVNETKMLEKGVAKLNKYKRKIISKGENNLFLDVIEQQLAATSGALVQAGLILISIETALEHLGDYEYVLDEEPELLGTDKKPLYGTHFINTSGA